ncbi:alpha/beta hydrolase [Streptomyces sp. NPDC057245]|uniref:alpha/beta hydrolase n=1 Tax=Streptomyces TaxID=1883 RepID=UPI001C1E6726|nr:alpha/beta hydrolase [Streptomyces sp. A108]MBU6533526.1 alpha/beta hydrolase [Streptomyces sp. A108]
MSDHTDHYAPNGLRTRGTVVVVPGRGETRATYGRLSARLAADAYRVRVVDAPDLTVRDGDDRGAALTRFGARLAEAVEGTADTDGVTEPVVLLGADAGAVALAAHLGRTGRLPGGRRPDALVLAGVPGRTAPGVGSWDEELDVRTSCPTHRGTLSNDARVRRGSLGEALPDALLDAAYDAELALPVLFLTGGTDPLADRAALLRTAESLPRARLSVVRDAHHDVLNDVQHRSVAAEIVTFLEALRGQLVPVVAVETSAW